MQFIIQDNCLMIQGVVSVETLTRQHYKQFVQLCRQPEVRAIDLSGVVRADSACISLLLTFLRQHASGSLKVVNVPVPVRMLAQLYEIDEWMSALDVDTVGVEMYA